MTACRWPSRRSRSVPSAVTPIARSSSRRQVDETSGRRARLHHVDERLPAGERAGAVVSLREAGSPRRRCRARVFDLAQKHACDQTRYLRDMSSEVRVARAMAGADAVFVGSGGQLARRRGAPAREGGLARLRAGAKRLARRRDPDRRRTSRRPGSRTRCFASWHPLLVGSPAYAELKPTISTQLGLEYLNTDLPTAPPSRTARAAFLSTVARAERRRARRTHRRWQLAASSTSSWPAWTSRSACSATELWSRRRALARPQGLLAATAAAASSSSRDTTLALGARLADRDVRRTSAPAACWRRGCCTPGSGLTRRCPAS